MKHIITYCTLLGLLLLVVLAAALVLDPYAAFQLRAFAPYHRVQFSTYSPFWAKMNGSRLVRPRNIIVGDSTLPPGYPSPVIHDGELFYNFGVASACLYDILEFVKFSADTFAVQKAVIELAYWHREGESAHVQSISKELSKDRLQTIQELTFSWQAVRDALTLTKAPSLLNSLAFAQDAAQTRPVDFFLPSYDRNELFFFTIALKTALQNAAPEKSLDPVLFKLPAAIFSEGKTKGVTCTFFLSPMNPYYIMAMKRVGIYEDFKKWREAITAQVGAVDCTALALLPSNVAGIPHLYQDMIHYLQPLGLQVVDAVLGQRAADQALRESLKMDLDGLVETWESLHAEQIAAFDAAHAEMRDEAKALPEQDLYLAYVGNYKNYGLLKVACHYFAVPLGHRVSLLNFFSGKDGVLVATSRPGIEEAVDRAAGG